MKKEVDSKAISFYYYVLETNNSRTCAGETSGRKDGDEVHLSSEVLLTGPSKAARNKKEEKMRSKLAILLAIAAVCATAVWADWTPEALVTGDTSINHELWWNNGHKVVFGTDGVGHLVWFGGTGIWYNRYNPPSQGLPGYWTPDFPIYQGTSGLTSSPAIALDADGTTIHVVWRSSGGGKLPATLFYGKCIQDPSGNDEWDAILSLCEDYGVSDPSVGCVPNDPDHVLVCWGDVKQSGGRVKFSYAIGFREYVNGGWTETVRLDPTSSLVRGRPSISAAPNGDVSVAYFGNDDNTSGRQVYVKTRSNGVWGPTVDVTKSFLSRLCDHQAVEANPLTNNPHVVFQGRTVVKIGKVEDTTWAVYHNYRNSSGVWLTTPELIAVSGHGYSNPLSDPTMSFVGDGTAYVAWHGNVPAMGHGNMYSYYSGEGGTWGNPAWLTSDPSGSYEDRNPFLAVEEPAHTIHVVWSRLYSGVPREIWWRSSPLGSGFDGGQAEPMATSQSGIELFPNPAKAGRVTVQYSLPRAEAVRVTLLDVSGRAVRTREVAAANRSGAFSIDVSGLNAGVYVARLVAGDLSVSKSLVVGR